MVKISDAPPGAFSLISQTRTGTTSYFLQDGQGSTRALTNGSGTVTDTYSYTAFGELFNQSGTTANSYLYTGQQFDSLTGLYDLRARYYNPTLGRFLSQDTYPYNFNSPVEMNRYVYAANQPINLSDPSGNAAIVEYSLLIGGIGGAAFGAVQTYVCGGSLAENVTMGALLGLDFAILAMEAPFAASALGLGLSLSGLHSGLQDMNIHGSTACNRFTVAMSLLGVVFSAHAMSEYSLPSEPLNLNSGQGYNISSYADEVSLGMPRYQQEILVRNLDPDAIIAVRPRPWGAYEWDGVVPPKTMDIKGAFKLIDSETGVDTGVRLTKDGRLVVSDVDIAGYTINGMPISDRAFLKSVAARFNTEYGYEVITHGHLVNGFDDPHVVAALFKEGGDARISGLLNETVYLFDAKGYIGSMKYWEYYRDYVIKGTNPNNIPK